MGFVNSVIAVFRNLMAALNRLRDDLDHVELWSAALTHFQSAPPAYRPDAQYKLPPRGEGSGH